MVQLTEEKMAHIKELRKKAMKLPLHPGVYIMHSRDDTIIYIGKAKALKNRVSQYFGSDKNHNEKVRRMVSNVEYFEYILTDSEFEALILESSLIKQHQPKYNILLKDDKGYSYIKVTAGDWPRISETKQVLNDGAKYIGPYLSAWTIKDTVEEARKIFRLPSCTRKFPQEIGGKTADEIFGIGTFRVYPVSCPVIEIARDGEGATKLISVTVKISCL